MDAAVNLNSIPVSPRAVSMRDHFAKNGYYRPADITWLLGNPWDSVGVDRDGNVRFISRDC